MSVAESAFVFNIVWTGSVFRYLRYFVASQIDHSESRFRFVVNGCPPDQIPLMEHFAEQYADRVLDVFESSNAMHAHGVALDAAFDRYDDGESFCFIDPDILARAPFVSAFAPSLDLHAGVTSGKGVWNDDVVVPVGHGGVPGECFYSPDGFLFGSPHFAMYRRSALEQTMDRWGVRFGSAGPDLSQRAKERLVAAGHRYWIYDTGKLVNFFLQEEGNTLDHFEHPALFHIGGMSHYLSPPEKQGRMLSPGEEPDQRWPWPEARLVVARFTAAHLRALCDGEPEPEPPSGLDATFAERLDIVRVALTELIGRYRPQLDSSV